MERDYSKISHTALIIASFRARYTNMPFSKEIYIEARKHRGHSLLEIITPLLAFFVKFFPGTIERLSSLEGRYLAINNAINGLCKDISIIEVASGLSPRSMEFIGSKSLYLETDLPEIINIKKKVICKVTKDLSLTLPKNHHFLSLDATNWEDWQNLGKNFFGGPNKKNIVIIHEGLVAYLTRDEQRILRDNIRRFLAIYSPKGVWLTTDFSLKKKKERFLVGIGKKLIENKTSRKFNHFGSTNEVMNFLDKGGFEAKIVDNSSLFNKLTCLKKERMNFMLVKKAMLDYKAYIITLKR